MSDYTKSTNFATKDNLTPGDPLKIVRGTEIDTEFNNIATAIATKTDNSAAAITGGSITGITDLAIADGGTGASTATAAINNLLPSQTSNANKYLQTDGTNVSWDAVSLSTSDITGTLPVANGGTGVTSSTGTGSVVLSNSPTLVTPTLGTPASATLTNATGLPISTGVSGLGTGVATFLATPSSANLATAVSDETGSGALVFANSPTLVTPALGTPSSATLTNATGLPISTGVSGLGTGVATFLGTPSSANLLAAVTDETGTGSLVFATSPTLVTPALGTPSSATLTNATGLPISTGVSGLGTGVATALAVNVGSAGAPVVNGGALGTPSSGTVTNLTGTASININGTVGATTPTTGAFTTVSASSSVTLSGGTANGVTYLNGSKVLTSGSALTFTGTNLGLGQTSPSYVIDILNSTPALRMIDATLQGAIIDASSNKLLISADPYNITAGTYTAFALDGSEQMRLTSTGLGIGTSSPSYKLEVYDATNPRLSLNTGASGTSELRFSTPSSGYQGLITYSAASNFMAFYTSATERLRLDSSGNLGLGVVPSAWASGYKVFDIGNGAVHYPNSASQIGVSANAYFNSGWIYKSTGNATLALQNAGQHIWYNAASGTAGNAISFTQAMTLDASGNLGVGTTSPTTYGKLAVIKGAGTSGGTDAPTLFVGTPNYGSGTFLGALQIGSTAGSDAFIAYGGRVASYTDGGVNATDLRFYNSNAERARIDSSGNWLVGTTNTNPAGNNTAGFAVQSGGLLSMSRDGNPAAFFNRSSSDGEIVRWYRQGSQVGNVSVTTTATAYNTSSDQRLKENIQDADSASSLIDSLQVRQFDWKSDNSHQRYGFVAQELVTVAPEAVHQPADPEEMMAVDYSKLVPILVKEIQSLRARVAQLETN